MRRRAFIPLVFGGAFLRPADGSSQTRGHTIGVLDSGEPGPLLDELRKMLRRLGYPDASLRFEVRASGNADELRRLADELVALKVDVIVARLTPALRAAMGATKTIPIVMTACGGPVESGLIASLARPGGNVTGMSLGGISLIGKRLEIIREVLPSVRHIAMVGARNDPFTRMILDGTEQKGREIGIKVSKLLLLSSNELAGALDALGNDQPEALHTMANLPADPVNVLGAQRRIPVFPTQRAAVESGALLSYGGLLEEQYRGAAIYVDRVLKGAKPETLPVEEPRHFDLVINLKTAKTLGLTISPLLMVRATEIFD
jgi:putative ABC transport system substrate-binding protein